MSRNICTRICFAFPWDIKIWMLCVQNDSDCNKDWLRQWKWDPTTLWFYKDFEAFLYNSKIILKNAFANWINCFCITPRDGSKSQQPEFVLEADLFLNTGIGNPVPYSDQKCMDYGASCIDYADQSCMDYPVVWIMYPGFHFTSLVLLAAFVTNVW